jgi:hypothetical protein
MSIPTKKLEQAFLALMSLAGKPTEPLGRQPGQRGPAPKAYRLQSGQTVRLRTNNRQAVIAKVESGAWDAPMPFESEDFLGVAFPGQRPNTVVGYLVPSAVAEREFKERQRGWLDEDPSHDRDNQMRELRFDGDEGVDGYGYSRRWAEYCLGEISLDALPAPAAPTPDARAQALAEARRNLAAVFQVPEQAVRISIDY